MEKPNCYTCKHRGPVSGDSHSCCNYPGTTLNMFAFFSSNNLEIAKKLNIKANEGGVKRGWFMWPVNFDPVWLEHCDGHEKQ